MIRPPQKAVLQSLAGPLASLVLMLSVVAGAEVVAQDRNPWAMPDPSTSMPMHRPQSDYRFAPEDYDPVNGRGRRPSRQGEFASPEIFGGPQYPYSGLSDSPEGFGSGLHDRTMGMTPWSGLYGAPGLTGYPGLYPYGAYPGSGMLWPGSGLANPGLPLYGSPLGTVPLLGTPY
jgi:hypothetical protein